MIHYVSCLLYCLFVPPFENLVDGGGDLGYNAIKNKGCFIFYIFIGLTVSMYYSHAIYLSRNEWDIDLPVGGGL